MSWTMRGLSTQMIVNLVDVLIIDIAIYMWWYPSWMQYEGHPPLHSYAYHINASLKGLLLSVPICFIAAGVAMLF